ncbi:PQQ-binding-like beta-propeller repeat protein, partial [bacterium]|nr:PQQ-binding-like beta-propeller repeat protein [bacterium]
PVKYESYIFVPYIDGRMVIYSEHGLEKISETKTESEYLSSPVIENNLLYTISKDGILYCIDYLEDQVLWKKNLEDVFVASPLIVNDLIFIGSINKMIYAFSKENGEKVFDYSVGGMVSSSAVYHRKKVYFAVEDGCVYAFE